MILNTAYIVSKYLLNRIKKNIAKLSTFKGKYCVLLSNVFCLRIIITY